MAVRFLSRRNNDLTKRFPLLQGVATLIQADNAVLDGEILAVDGKGRPCFDQLRARRTDCEILYYAFDILHQNDQGLMDQSLRHRNSALASVLPESDVGRLRVTDYIVTQGEALFHELEKQKLEGMLAKRIESLYVSGRSKDWLKIKTGSGKEVMRTRSEAWEALVRKG